MPVYRIADINFKFSPKSERVKQMLSDYISECEKYDFSISIQQSDVELEKRVSENGIYDESTALCRKLSNYITKNCNGVLFHGVAMLFKGKAYIFTAPSGTGKTTHLQIWQRCFGDSVTVINGDKPILRKIGNKIIVFGNPWQGKENYGSNISGELDGIFLLSRNTTNSCTKIPSVDALARLLKQTAIPTGIEGKMKALDFLESLVTGVNMYDLQCNMNDEAAYTAYKTINKE